MKTRKFLSSIHRVLEMSGSKLSNPNRLDLAANLLTKLQYGRLRL